MEHGGERRREIGHMGDIGQMGEEGRERPTPNPSSQEGNLKEVR